MPLFDISQPTLSHHLKKLRDAGIVTKNPGEGVLVQVDLQEDFSLNHALGLYLDTMARIIQQETHGAIDKYIGDAVMGLFPSSPSDALRDFSTDRPPKANSPPWCEPWPRSRTVFSPPPSRCWRRARACIESIGWAVFA